MNININGSTRKLKSICVGQEDNKVAKIYDDGISFGQDTDGNWGYIVPGSNKVTPFGGSNGIISINKWEIISGEELLEKNGDQYTLAKGRVNIAFVINVSSAVNTVISYLSVTSSQNSATVYLNGDIIWTPTTSIDLSAGRHDITLNLIAGVNNVTFVTNSPNNPLTFLLSPIAT